MKSFTRLLTVFLSIFLIFASFSCLFLHLNSFTADASPKSFADLYMDLPMHYMVQNNYTEFTAKDYYQFESLFADAGLAPAENGFKRSFFANNSKFFDLQSRLTQQKYTLYLKILSVLVIHREEENMDFGFPYYLSGIQCPNNEKLFIVHYNKDFTVPIFGVLCSSTGDKIWQWKLSQEASRTYRTIDQTYQEITASLEAKNLISFIDPLNVLFSSWLWSDYLERYTIPVLGTSPISWDSPTIPKTSENLLKQLTDNYKIENASYSWSDSDTIQILKCIETVYSERWDKKYMNLTFNRTYQMQKKDDTLVFIPYISIKFKIESTSYGFGFSGLKDSKGAWSFWINDVFYCSDQTVIQSKSMNSRLMNQMPNKDPFIQYLLMMGTFAFQNIDSFYIPAVILAYASSLYDTTQTQNTKVIPMSKSSHNIDDQSSNILNCESLFRQIVNTMDLMVEPKPLDASEQSALARVLLSTEYQQNESIASIQFEINKTYKMYNRDTNETYRLIPNLNATITFQNGEKSYFFEFTALQNGKKDWVVLDNWKLWKVAFSSGIVSDDAYLIFSKFLIQNIYVAYQLHYSYLIRSQISVKDLMDFSILFSAATWKDYLYDLVLPSEIPSKDHVYEPSIPNLGSLTSYLTDHYLLKMDGNYSMSQADKDLFENFFKDLLKDSSLDSLDWSTFKISYTTPYQLVGKQGNLIWYFKQISLSVKGDHGSGANTQRSWIKDEKGDWISFSPLRYIESIKGWKIKSINDFSDTYMSAYTIYIGYYARANWEKKMIPCPDLIPLLCSLDLHFNARNYKNR